MQFKLQYINEIEYYSFRLPAYELTWLNKINCLNLPSMNIIQGCLLHFTEDYFQTDFKVKLLVILMEVLVLCT